jgi:aminopeptidase N
VITTEQFRQLADEFVPPQPAGSDLSSFFENWVYGTGIPAIKLTYVVRGLKLTGTVTQGDVSEDFTARIPIEVQTGKIRTLHWVVSSSDPVPFSVNLPGPAVKVALAVKDALITVKK